MDARIKPDEARKMERVWQVRRRIVEIMDIICGEFETDPSSVTCFDLRIVDEAISLNKEIKKLSREVPFA